MQKNKQSKKLTNRLPEWRARTKLTQQQTTGENGGRKQTNTSIKKKKKQPIMQNRLQILHPSPKAPPTKRFIFPITSYAIYY
ncbi:transcriptional regulator [Bacillus velezensis]|uniref:transcriptional regulator n=1 Tax=Bacillus velezensis TaxID=492670 RepID=UPI0015CA9421|nr:transcriptional regulator [Bacillus velezensis]